MPRATKGAARTRARRRIMRQAKGFVGGGTFIFLIDHMNGGMTIYGNLFHQLEYPGTIYSGGRENMIENNVFYQCIRAVTLEDRSWVYNAENRPPKRLLENYLRGVHHDRPPWSARYPQLTTILDRENPALPENNLVARNVSVKVVQFLRAVPVTRDLATIESNWEGRDPGFADPDNGNFAIRPDSTVFGAIGFDPIPPISGRAARDLARAP